MAQRCAKEHHRDDPDAANALVRWLEDKKHCRVFKCPLRPSQSLFYAFNVHGYLRHNPNYGPDEADDEVNLAECRNMRNQLVNNYKEKLADEANNDAVTFTEVRALVRKDDELSEIEPAGDMDAWLKRIGGTGNGDIATLRFLAADLGFMALVFVPALQKMKGNAAYRGVGINYSNYKKNRLPLLIFTLINNQWQAVRGPATVTTQTFNVPYTALDLYRDDIDLASTTRLSTGADAVEEFEAAMAALLSPEDAQVERIMSGTYSQRTRNLTPDERDNLVNVLKKLIPYMHKGVCSFEKGDRHGFIHGQVNATMPLLRFACTAVHSLFAHICLRRLPCACVHCTARLDMLQLACHSQCACACVQFMLLMDVVHTDAAPAQWAQLFHDLLRTRRGDNSHIMIKLHPIRGPVNPPRMFGYTQKGKGKRGFDCAFRHNCTQAFLDRAYEEYWAVRISPLTMLCTTLACDIAEERTFAGERNRVVRQAYAAVAHRAATAGSQLPGQVLASCAPPHRADRALHAADKELSVAPALGSASLRRLLRP